MAKSKYFTHVQPNLEKIKELVENGALDKDLYEILNISRDAFYKYKNLHSDFKEALSRSKEIVDTQVENALFNNAMGHEYDEEVYELVDGELKLTKVTKKKAMPNTSAQIFWLKNRKPNDWRDKQNIETEANVTVKNPLEGMSTEELKKLLNK